MNAGDDFDSIDRSMLQNGWCPDCAADLLPGPRGGAAQNFYCSNRDGCRAGFNLTFKFGRLLMAERIGEVDDERFAIYAPDDGR
jgi:hypothetical protein